MEKLQGLKVEFLHSGPGSLGVDFTLRMWSSPLFPDCESPFLLLPSSLWEMVLIPYSNPNLISLKLPRGLHGSKRLRGEIVTAMASLKHFLLLLLGNKISGLVCCELGPTSSKGEIKHVKLFMLFLGRRPSVWDPMSTGSWLLPSWCIYRGSYIKYVFTRKPSNFFIFARSPLPWLWKGSLGLPHWVLGRLQEMICMGIFCKSCGWNVLIQLNMGDADNKLEEFRDKREKWYIRKLEEGIMEEAMPSGLV